MAHVGEKPGFRAAHSLNLAGLFMCLLILRPEELCKEPHHEKDNDFNAEREGFDDDLPE